MQNVPLVQINDVDIRGAACARVQSSLTLLGLENKNPIKDPWQVIRSSAEAGDFVAKELITQELLCTGLAQSNSNAESVCNKPVISFWPNFLNRFECAYLIAATRGILHPSRVIDENTGSRQRNEFRTSDTAWWNTESMDPIISHIHRKVVEAFNGKIEQAEPMSIVRYKQGGKFMAHLDAVKDYSEKKIRGVVRASTSIVYLNEDYQGGETAFLKPRIKIRGMTGDVLHFRNLTSDGQVDMDSVHAGMPVTRGEKWVIVQWIRR